MPVQTGGDPQAQPSQEHKSMPGFPMEVRMADGGGYVLEMTSRCRHCEPTCYEGTGLIQACIELEWKSSFVFSIVNWFFDAG